MKYLLLLIAILLISCAGTQYKVDTSRLKNLDDFSEAKDLLASNFSSIAKDSTHHAVNYAFEYLKSAHELQAKLSTIDTNIAFNSVEESELLTLFMISNTRDSEPSNNEESLDAVTKLSATDSIVNTFLQAIDNHNSNIEKQKTKKILNGDTTKTERAIAESINFETAQKNISSKAFSDEERDIMGLYSQFLLIKYNRHFRRYLHKKDELSIIDKGDKWFDENKKKFLQKHPNAKYRPFLDGIKTSIEEQKKDAEKAKFENIAGALLSIAGVIAIYLLFISPLRASSGMGD